MSNLTLGDITQLLEQKYPANSAADWDCVGLVVGNPTATVKRILLVVDVTKETVDEAISKEASLIIAHHPLLLSGVTSISESTHKGELLTTLVRNDIALFTAHTNADSARPGVSDALALTLGLKLESDCVLEPETGIGRIGTLPNPVLARQFVDQISTVLEYSPSPVLLAGNPDKLITTVAVCGGAGDSLLPIVGVSRADAYVTSDLRHHLASEFVADSKCVLINIAHWAGEWPWLNLLAQLLGDAFADKVEVLVSRIPTDPWTMSTARS